MQDGSKSWAEEVEQEEQLKGLNNNHNNKKKNRKSNKRSGRSVGDKEEALQAMPQAAGSTRSTGKNVGYKQQQQQQQHQHQQVEVEEAEEQEQGEEQGWRTVPPANRGGRSLRGRAGGRGGRAPYYAGQGRAAASSYYYDPPHPHSFQSAWRLPPPHHPSNFHRWPPAPNLASQQQSGPRSWNQVQVQVVQVRQQQRWPQQQQQQQLGLQERNGNGNGNGNGGAEEEDPVLFGHLLPPEEEQGQVGGGGGGKLKLTLARNDSNDDNDEEEEDDIAALRQLSDASLDDDDSDSDWMDGEDEFFDSDASQHSHESQKKNKWFLQFFTDMDALQVEEIKSGNRDWHCPACRGGPGAVAWFRGLQALLSHAKTVRSKRIKLHQQFAALLEHEVDSRGVAAAAAAETGSSKWRGLRSSDQEHTARIVWPPCVIIQNTRLDTDDNDKWSGMNNAQLLKQFEEYNPLKAKQAYGPQGHRGLSLLIFGESPVGYYNAQRLDSHFREARRGRQHWESPARQPFIHGDRILYGYYATAEDMDDFNKHAKGKSAQKWEERLLKEVVLTPMKEVDKNTARKYALELEVEKHRERSKFHKTLVGKLAREVQMRDKDMATLVRQFDEFREQSRIEIEDSDQMYNAKLSEQRLIHIEHEKQVQELQEKLKQACLERCQQLELDLSNENEAGEEERRRLNEELNMQTQMFDTKLRESEEYQRSKNKLAEEHHAKRKELMQRQYEEKLKFEKELEEEKEQLLLKFKSRFAAA